MHFITKDTHCTSNQDLQNMVKPEPYLSLIRSHTLAVNDYKIFMKANFC